MDRIDHLIEQLNSPAVPDRVAAAEALGRLGPGAAAALPPLLDRFADVEDHAERRALALALYRIDPGSLRPGRLVGTVRRRQESARAWARTLGESQALTRARDVLRAWADDTPEVERHGAVRQAAAQVVQGPGFLREFMELHAGRMAPDDLAAVLYLAGRGLPEAHEVLGALRDHPDARVAAAASRVFGRVEAERALADEGTQLAALAVEHEAVVPVLLDAFLNLPRLRRRLGLVLQYVVLERPGVTDRLVPLLGSGDVEVAQQAAEALGCARLDGPPARALAQSLLCLLDRSDCDDLDWDTPERQLVGLEQGPGGREVVEAVLARVRAAPESASSPQLCEVLASMAVQAPAGPGSEALARLMEAEDARIRVGALRAGGALNDERITRACSAALRDANADVRSAAAGAMTRWARGRLAGVWKQLLPGLEDRCPGVAEAVADCLGRVGPAAGGALPALRARLEEAQAVLDGLPANARRGRAAAKDDTVRRARESVRRFRDALARIEWPSAP
jgi:HEAT repeat protein